MAVQWTTENMPDLTGKTTLVTGANSGLGLEISRALAAKGAHVVMACRDTKRGEQAADMLRQEKPSGTLDVMALDLADLDLVRRFAQEYSGRNVSLDILCNNAGVMHLPFRETAQGFEMQFGTNHLGHFALTGLLLPALLKTPLARVVTTSSVLHQQGHIHFDDLQAKIRYNEGQAYSQSKLANLLFAYELQRQFTAHHVSAMSLAAHPGYSATNLQAAGPRMSGSVLREQMMRVMNTVLAQSARMGALPTLYAATSSTLHGGEYIGPDGFREFRGHPVIVKSNAESYDLDVARRLWKVSEELTGVVYAPAFASQAPIVNA